MNIKKLISVIALFAIAATSVFLLLCPHILITGGAPDHCGRVIGQLSGASIGSASPACMQNNIAVFKSLDYILPESLTLFTLIILAAVALSMAWAIQATATDQTYWQEFFTLIYKHYSKLTRPRLDFKILRWLSLQKNGFALIIA